MTNLQLITIVGMFTIKQNLDAQKRDLEKAINICKRFPHARHGLTNSSSYLNVGQFDIKIAGSDILPILELQLVSITEEYNKVVRDIESLTVTDDYAVLTPKSHE